MTRVKCILDLSNADDNLQKFNKWLDLFENSLKFKREKWIDKLKSVLESTARNLPNRLTIVRLTYDKDWKISIAFTYRMKLINNIEELDQVLKSFSKCNLNYYSEIEIYKSAEQSDLPFPDDIPENVVLTTTDSHTFSDCELLGYETIHPVFYVDSKELN